MLNQQRRERRLPQHHLICVFEAANDTLKEVYLGTSRHLIGQLTRDLAARLPRGVRHWRKEHRIRVRCLEYSIQAGEAGAFMDAYARSGALAGWTVRRDASRQEEIRDRAGAVKRPRRRRAAAPT